MKYAIEILKERLEQMENAYQKFVVNGDVKPDSSVAIDNREKVKQLQSAIKTLSNEK